MNKNLKIMLAQLNPTVGALEKNSKIILETYKKAAEQKVDILTFPEMFLSGYQLQDLVLKKAFQKDINNFINFLVKKCRNSTRLLLGAPIVEEEKLFNAYLLINKGEMKVISKKFHLPNNSLFDEHRYFEQSHYKDLIEVKGIKIGFPICEDIWYGDISNALKKRGADLLISPNGSPYERHKLRKRQTEVFKRCKENNIPIIYLNLVGGQDDQVFDGGSFAMDNNGNIKTQLPQFKQTTVILEFEKKEPFFKSSKNMISEIKNDLSQDYRAISEGTKDYILKSGFNNVLIGLSGGIDSALVAAIAVDILGHENVYCIKLPSQYTSKLSLIDADQLLKNLNCEAKTISISKIYDLIKETLFPTILGKKENETEENIQSRIRGLLLMALSNDSGSLLLTTGNKSEIAVGYSTIYGDMCGGYNPIKDLYKTRLYEICKWRNSSYESWMKGPKGSIIPKSILEKQPTAELRPNQADQDSLPPYEILDSILECLIEHDMSISEIVKKGHEYNMVKKIEKLVFQSEYKRFQSAPGVHITENSFQLSRRYPIVQNWRDNL
ncbi:MAG: NAD+ synthase [Paracoccaceae bacterium]